nr:hypothetical protein [Nanoarchaeota archaeon]
MYRKAEYIIIAGFVALAICMYVGYNQINIAKNNKLTESIKVANDGRADITDSEISLLETRIWKLENPPKYAVGDKVDDYVVVRVEIRRDMCNYQYWSYYIVDINTGKSYWRENPAVEPLIYFDY